MADYLSDAKNKELAQKLERSDEKAKQLATKLETTNEELKKRRTFEQSDSEIKRHKYSARLIGLCIALYLVVRCPYHSIERIIKVPNCFFQLGLKDTPSWGSIKNWIEKCGFNTYNEDKKSMLSEKAYALIVNEIMNVGGDKLLAVLGVKAQKETQGTLTINQVRILDMKVRRSSLTAADVAGQLRKATQESTMPPAYVISDNASNITKAIFKKKYWDIIREAEALYQGGRKPLVLF